MSKHLKIRATIDPKDMSYAILEVVEQTHFYTAFSDITKGGYTNGFVHDDVVIVSATNHVNFSENFALPSGEKRYISVFIPERENSSPSNIRVPSHLWPKIKEAVKAYNYAFYY
jgi:hypothetical protein